MTDAVWMEMESGDAKRPRDLADINIITKLTKI